MTSDELCRAAGITYRQLDHWCRRGFIPGRHSFGSGSVRSFTPREVRHVVAMARLIDAGFTPPAAAELAMRSVGERSPWRRWRAARVVS